MAEESLQADVWLPAQAATALFGSSRADSSFPLPTGGTFWVPGDPEQHPIYGSRFKANGTPTQLQHMAHTVLQQCLSCLLQHQPGVVDCSPAAAQWWVLGAGSTQMGPFSGSHLQQFLSSGVCQQEQLICHGPATVWMPLWLVLQLVGLQAPPPQQPQALQQSSKVPRHSGPQQNSRQAQHHQQDRQQHQASPQQSPAASSSAQPARHHSTPKAKADKDLDPDEYGYGVSSSSRKGSSTKAWLEKVKALEAATKAKQQHEKQQQQGQGKPGQSGAAHVQQQGRSQPDISCADADAELLDVLQAVSQLRGDQEYLDELCRAVAMDIDLPHDPAHPVGAADTCNVVDLASVAAGAAAADAASSSWLQQSQVQLVVVLDTNVLLEAKLVRALQGLQQMQQQQGGSILVPLPQQQQGVADGSSDGRSALYMGPANGQPGTAAVCVQVVIPWTLLIELDRLKLRSGAVAEHSRWAVEELRRELVSSTDTPTAAGQGSCSIFTVQSLQEFRQAAQDCDFGVPASALVGDDRILQCALSKQQRLRQQERQQDPGAAGQGWTRTGVLLLSNDKVLQLKAKANGIAVAGLADLPPLDAAAASTAPGTKSPSASPGSQHLPAYVARMLQLSGMTPPWLWHALAVDSSMQFGVSAHQHSRPSGSTVGSAQQANQARSSSCSPIQGGLQQQGAIHASAASHKHAAYTQQHMQHVQGVQDQHHHNQQQQQHETSKQREAAVSFLTFLRRNLSDQVLGWFQAELGEFWQNVLLIKPPWSDLEFILVLNHHWNSTLKGHLVALDKHRAGHIKSSVEYLKEKAKQLQSRHFKGDSVSNLSMQVGVRVVEVLKAFGSTHAAQQIENVLTAAAAGTTQDAGSVTLNVCELRDGRGAAGATAVPELQAVDTSAQPGASTGPAASAAGVAGEAGMSHMQAIHMHQQQQPQGHGNSMHQGEHASATAASVGAVAAAAAAVAAPQPEGPCLALGQLLLYAVNLLHAVLPLLGQLLAGVAAGTAGPVGQSGGAGVGVGVSAEALQWGMTVEQQLRRVVQHLERLGQHLGQLTQQQQPGLDDEILQMGLRVVELCSVLLNDEAARSSVSQQLLLHANSFVSQASGYLTGSGHQGDHAAGPAVMLQQLTAALQHLQHLLMQAVHLG